MFDMNNAIYAAASGQAAPNPKESEASKPSGNMPLDSH